MWGQTVTWKCRRFCGIDTSHISLLLWLLVANDILITSEEKRRSDIRWRYGYSFVRFIPFYNHSDHLQNALKILIKWYRSSGMLLFTNIYKFLNFHSVLSKVKLLSYHLKILSDPWLQYHTWKNNLVERVRQSPAAYYYVTVVRLILKCSKW